MFNRLKEFYLYGKVYEIKRERSLIKRNTSEERKRLLEDYSPEQEVRRQLLTPRQQTEHHSDVDTMILTTKSLKVIGH